MGRQFYCQKQGQRHILDKGTIIDYGAFLPMTTKDTGILFYQMLVGWSVGRLVGWLIGRLRPTDRPTKDLYVVKQCCMFTYRINMFAFYLQGISIYVKNKMNNYVNT